MGTAPLSGVAKSRLGRRNLIQAVQAGVSAARDAGDEEKKRRAMEIVRQKGGIGKMKANRATSSAPAPIKAALVAREKEKENAHPQTQARAPPRGAAARTPSFFDDNREPPQSGAAGKGKGWASLGGRLPPPRAPPLAAPAKAPAPGASAFAASFSKFSAAGPSEGGVKSRYATEADLEEDEGLNKRMRVLEQKDQIARKMEETMSLEVRAFHCLDCETILEFRSRECAEHRVHRIPKALKRFFRCKGCGRPESAINSRFPRHVCGKCRARDWERTGMLRPKKDAAADLAPRASVTAEDLKPRGQEHSFSLMHGL